VSKNNTTRFTRIEDLKQTYFDGAKSLERINDKLKIRGVPRHPSQMAFQKDQDLK